MSPDADTLNRSRLDAEFGPAFLIMAVYSGELNGYSFTNWEEFDRRIDAWVQALGTSRSNVARQWINIWSELGDEATCQQRGEALDSALRWWAAEGAHPQYELPEPHRHPAVKEHNAVRSDGLEAFAHGDVAPDEGRPEL